MTFRSMPRWQIALLTAFIFVVLIPVITWHRFTSHDTSAAHRVILWVSTITSSILRGQIALLGALSIVLLVLIRRFKIGNEESALRMTLFVTGDSTVSRKVTGQIMGAGASSYRARGYNVILYAKVDIWFNEPFEGAVIRLNRDCSWCAEGVRNAHEYAAFLVAKDYKHPTALPSNAGLPLLPVDGIQVVAWMIWPPVTPGSPVQPDELALAVQWLAEQICPNKIIPDPLPDRMGLIIGYRVPNTYQGNPAIFSRSWIYDNALATIGFVLNGRIAEAQAVFNAIRGQIHNDGKIGFAYDTVTEWYHKDYRSETIAWLGYAWVFYQQATSDAQSQVTAEHIANYLLALQNMDPASPSYGSIPGAPNAFWYTTTSNIITYFFLRDLGRITGNATYLTGADRIKNSLLSHHWNERLGRFDQGIGDPTTGLIEVASLGTLFLIAIGDIVRAQSTLASAECTYQPVPAADLQYGYAPYMDRSTVWSQGSLQIALACRRLGEMSKSSQVIQEIVKLQDDKGGFPYAIPEATVMTEEIFYEWPSVAGTNWFVIVRSDDGRFLGA